jgi:hypothetical protein
MLKREGRWLAALSRHVAAALHNLRVSHRSRIDVTVTGRRIVRARGIVAHRSTTLRQQDITIVNKIPVTTVARTILDLAEDLTRDQLRGVLEEAEVRGVLDEVALREQIAHNAHRPAARKLAALLDKYEYDMGQVMNEFEAAMRCALRAAGAPQPVSGRRLVLPDGGPGIKPDFQWPEQKVVLHADGFKFHRMRWKFERDLRNDQRLLDAQWLPIRASWRQLRDEPDRMIGTVLRRLAERGWRSDGLTGGWDRRGGWGRRRDRRLQPREAHEPLAASERHGDLERDPPAEAAQIARRVALLDDRGHLDPVEPAGDDVAEWLQVVLDVDGEAVGGYSARDVDADRGDLPLIDPDAGVVRAIIRSAAGVEALLCQCGDERLLERADVGDDVIDADDRVPDQLTRAVVGDLAAAVGLDDLDPLHLVPLLAHRQVASGRAPAAGQHRPVLQQQHHVGNKTLLAGVANTLLQHQCGPVVERAEVTDPKLRR